MAMRLREALHEAGAIAGGSGEASRPFRLRQVAKSAGLKPGDGGSTPSPLTIRLEACVTIGQILRTAAARVRLNWIQGSGIDIDAPFETAGVCTYGGVAVAILGKDYCLGAMPTEDDRALFLACGEWINRALGVKPDSTWVFSESMAIWSPIYQWNDRPGQTVENVAMTLELAAILWEQHEQAPVAPVAQLDRAPAF